MNGQEKLLKTRFEISFVESTGSCGILHIGLCLFQSFVDSLPVIEPSGKTYDFGTDKDVGTAARLF